jgi:glucose-6-phosphate dehydrogenase assembly protein OpcA
MSIDLTDTNAAKIASALIRARRDAGSPTMGMVLTFIVVADEGSHYDALKAARAVSREHPSRVIGVIRRSSRRGTAKLDAEIRIGDGTSGEQVLLRMHGELANHAESVVLPLLLPDSPTVIWWPGKAPDDPATDPLGALAQRRITDAAALDRRRASAMLTQAANYSPGNTDLSWTRITPWRALLAAALDQYPAKVLSGVVSAERANPSADLLIAWLTDRLDVEIRRAITRGPGITDVSLMTGGGKIEIARPDGRLAHFTIPNSPERPVALNRRELAELLAEELRRLDPDDVYEDTVKALCRLSDKVPDPTSKQLAERTHAAEEAAARVGTPPTAPGPREKDMRAVEAAELEEKIGSRRANAGKTAASERAAKKTTTKKTAAKKTTTKKTAAKKTAAKKTAASS